MFQGYHEFCSKARCLLASKPIAQLLPAQMLRIRNLAGETLAAFSADEVEGKSVKEMKTSLAKQIGATRFQQRWLAEDHTELHDDAAVPCCEVQLVVVDFVQAAEGEIGNVVSACRKNRPDELVDLLRKPLDPQGARERERFLHALNFAAQKGHWQIVQLLLEAGTRTRDGRTPLHIAAANGNSEVVKLLLEAGAAPNGCEHEFGRTALHWAAENGRLRIVKLLLEAGADKEVADSYGKLPVHMAEYYDHFEVANLLQPKL